MSEITVRPLGVDDWEQYRSVRLVALQESPDAFVASYDDEGSYLHDVFHHVLNYPPTWPDVKTAAPRMRGHLRCRGPRIRRGRR